MLKELDKLENVDNNKLGQAIVTSEYLIKDDRRIDIVIELGNRFIPIEVGHSPSSYSTDKRKNDTSHAIGAVPNDDIVVISFMDNILPWLEACKNINNPGMYPILNQFQASINIANAVNAAKVEVMKSLFKELEVQLEPIASKYGWQKEKTANWREYQNNREIDEGKVNEFDVEICNFFGG